MGHNMTKYILALLILATVTPQIAAQCPARKNTGSIANPSSDAGRCENEGTNCSVASSGSTGKCATSWKLGSWSCGCSPNGATPYFVLTGGTLTTSGPPANATGVIEIISVNGFLGTVMTSCYITPVPVNTNVPCSVTPSSQPVGSSGGRVSLSVPTTALAPGNYTVAVVATTNTVGGYTGGTGEIYGSGQCVGLSCIKGSPACGLEFPNPPGCTHPNPPGTVPPPSTVSVPPPTVPTPDGNAASISLTLLIPPATSPKTAGGSLLSLICFAVVVVSWIWRHKKHVRRGASR